LPIGAKPEVGGRASLGALAEQPPQAGEVDWAALSERSQATLRLCWTRMLLGYGVVETAEALGGVLIRLG
jgi:hypothetical protein